VKLPDPDSYDEPVDPNSGSFILDQLRGAGSNVGKEHEFSFWMYFPTEDLAGQARERLAAMGFEVSVSPPLPDYTDWLCLAYARLIPNESQLEDLSRRLKSLTAEYCGKYDGWESGLLIDEEEKDAGRES